MAHPQITQGHTSYHGAIGVQVIRHRPPRRLTDIPRREWHQPSLMDLMRAALPLRGLPPEINRWRRGNVRNFFSGLWPIAMARKLKLFHMFGSLYLSVQYGDGPMITYGLAGLKKVTDTGVAFLVDAWQGTVEMEDLKYHGIGTGSTAESPSQTALVTELTTEYTGNVRATGSLTEGASANIFRSLGTNTLDAGTNIILREHGLFSQAATGGGVMWDRTLYDAITLSSGDSLASTYDLTASSEA